MSSDEDAEPEGLEDPPLSCHIVATEQHVYVARLRLGRLEWTIRRRFREFRALDEELRALRIRPAVHLPRRQLMGSTTEATVQRRRQRLSRYVVASYEASRAQAALGGSFNCVGATPSSARLREDQVRALQRHGRSVLPDEDTVDGGNAQVGIAAPPGRAGSPPPGYHRSCGGAEDGATLQADAGGDSDNALAPAPEGGADGSGETVKLLRRLCDLPTGLASFLAVPHLVRCSRPSPLAPSSVRIMPGMTRRLPHRRLSRRRRWRKRCWAEARLVTPAAAPRCSEHEGNDPLRLLAATRLALKDEQRRSAELEARAWDTEQELEELRDEVARLRDAAGETDTSGGVHPGE